MRERLIKVLATGLGAGCFPVAPGTAGSVVGLGYWWLLTRLGNEWLYFAVLVLVVAVAVWCAGAAAKLFRQPDPPRVVIDEIAAVPLALAGADLDWRWWKIAAAFVLFRVFDVWKPLGIRKLQKIPGGPGIVIDDLAAAALAAAVTQGVAAVWWAVGR